jgi:serine/threonine protein kinase
MDVPHIIAGRFRIECEIGKGGMGTVYRATHLGLERPVAVKIIKAEYALDPDLAERFMREARTMARLRHTHAAIIFDAGNLPDGRHFIVMEFVEGETLSEALARESPFTPERTVKIVSDICSVLAEAHSLGIVHRDLKPSNIMLTDRGVCVLDFGVAKVLATSTDATATHATTGSGMIVGTPRYMSPEQCLGHRVGARSDLYSLGILAYEMLTGHPPFTDALPSAVLVKQATAAPPPLWSARQGLPQALVSAVHTLLAKRAEHRPANANAARELLQKSISKPVRSQEAPEPFAGMVASLNSPGRGVFKTAAPIAILGILVFGLFSRGASNPFNWKSAAPVEAASLTASDAKVSAANPLTKVALGANADMSKYVSANLAKDAVPDVRTIHGRQGDQIVAMRSAGVSGQAYMFALEKQGDGFGIVKRASLDTLDFKSADWKAQQLDLDGDGYDEVIYTGRKGKNRATTVRMVVYKIRGSEVFTLRAQPDPGSGATRFTMSQNLKRKSLNFLRRALQERLKDEYVKSGKISTEVAGKR